MDTEDAIVADPLENRRSFLPGRPNNKDDIVQSMKGDLFIDDVTSEAAQLMLSTLPQDVERLHIAPIVSPTTIIHGDLHSQNVLVECQQGECWPIDFAWCRDEASPAVDCAMLECSIKFMGIPMRADLRTLFELDSALLQQPQPQLALGQVPYRPEISNAWNAVMAVRRYVLEQLQISFDDYRKCLPLDDLHLTSSCSEVVRGNPDLRTRTSLPHRRPQGPGGSRATW